MTEQNEIWDVFISYASEDRDAVAAPLAQVLAHLGLRVWFDRAELQVGDSLRDRIDHGLAQSRFGIVILSEAFFGKHWPTRELNGLAQLEVDGRKMILPVWHGVDERAVRRFSPPLADRVALAWSNGVYAVANDLLEVIRPDVAQKIHDASKRIVALPPLGSGKELAALVAHAHMFQFFNQGAETKEESEQLASFLQQMQDWGDIWSDLEVAGHIEAEFSMQDSLTNLNSSGWRAYGIRTKRKLKVAGTVSEFDVAVLAVVKGEPPAVFLDGDQVLVPKTTTQVV